MVLTLLIHQWKYFWRSSSVGKNIAAQIITSFVALYLLLTAFFIGFSMETFIKQYYRSTNIISPFCSFILYYFLIDIIVRFMWQELPTLAAQPYLIQNIRRKQLVAFLNIRSIFSFLNLLPLLLFIPFIISVISKEFSSMATTLFIVSIFALCTGNHFLVLFIKRKTINNNWWLFGLLVTLALFAAADYYNVISLRELSTSIFMSFLLRPSLCFVTVLWATVIFYNNSRFLLKHLYLEEQAPVSSQKNTSGYNLFQKIDKIVNLIDIDLKLILRNKRPRSIMMLSLVFLFYGFVMFKKNTIEKTGLGLVLFTSMIIVAIFSISYGQYLFAWQSTYFDGIMANNINIKTYIKSKFRLITIFCTPPFLLSLFYSLIDWRISLVLTAAYFFNIGIQPIITVYFATFNYKGLDISKSSFLNYQGMSATQWVYSLVIMLIVVAIYLPFYFFHYEWIGILCVGIVGLINFILQDRWVNILCKQFIQNKYKILEGFREN